MFLSFGVGTMFLAGGAFLPYRYLRPGIERDCSRLEALQQTKYLRPVNTIRFVVHDSYPGVCDRINTRSIGSYFIFFGRKILVPQRMTFAFCEICFKRRRNRVSEY